MTGEQKKRPEGADHSPEANHEAQRRQRILSPKRKRFENSFDDYMETKYVV